jgi:replicative DNA helicase
LDEKSMRVTTATVTRAFPTGRKPIFRVQTRLGRSIRATANHPFRTVAGWARLDELKTGERVALPRTIPSARRPVLGAQAGRLALVGSMTETVPADEPILAGVGSGLVERVDYPPPWLVRRAWESEDKVCRTPLAAHTHQTGPSPTSDDVLWDEIVAITPDGVEEVFDLTVPGPHNFVANGFIVHNSIEQDADTCMMLHRPGKFDGTQEDNILEVIIAKQRNGPTGEVTLTYLKQYMRYENYIADAGFEGGM